MLPCACLVVTFCALPLWNSPAFAAEDVVSPKPGQNLLPCSAPELWVSLQSLQDPVIFPVAIGTIPCPLQ